MSSGREAKGNQRVKKKTFVFYGIMFQKRSHSAERHPQFLTNSPWLLIRKRLMSGRKWWMVMWSLHDSFLWWAGEIAPFRSLWHFLAGSTSRLRSELCNSARSPEIRLIKTRVQQRMTKSSPRQSLNWFTLIFGSLAQCFGSLMMNFSPVTLELGQLSGMISRLSLMVMMSWWERNFFLFIF